MQRIWKRRVTVDNTTFSSDDANIQNSPSNVIPSPIEDKVEHQGCSHGFFVPLEKYGIIYKQP